MLTFEERVLCGNLLEWFGSGLEPDPEVSWEFVPVANIINGCSIVRGGRDIIDSIVATPRLPIG